MYVILRKHCPCTSGMLYAIVHLMDVPTNTVQDIRLIEMAYVSARELRR